MAELISVSEFARRVDVDESTVRGYINNSRFKAGVTFDESGRRKMDWEVAHAEWKEFGGGLSKSSRRGFVSGSGAETSNPNSTPASNSGETDEDSFKTIEESKKKTEHFKALTAELDYEEKVGSLVRKEDVYANLYEYGINLRKALLSVPDLCVDNVMAAKTRQEAHVAIYEEIEKVLLRLTADGVLEKAGEDEKD